MKYFAYGSNMSLKRLKQRIPSAQRLGLYQLPAHQLKFHKKGQDGSAKCDAQHTGNPDDIVFGALFDIDQNDKPTLDRIEGVGRGYEIKEVIVTNTSGQQTTAYTYIATLITTDLLPFSWYLNHVLIGAKEVSIPPDYLTSIANTPAIDDHNTQREALNRQLYES